MKQLPIALALSLVLASCAGSSAVTDPVTAPPPTSAPPTATAAPTAPPSPVISAKGFITLTSPTVNAKLQSPVIITGDASVFEAALQWRITDTGGRVIAEGNTTASLGAPGRGTFSVSVPYTVRASEIIAFVEVYSRSGDGGLFVPQVEIELSRCDARAGSELL